MQTDMPLQSYRTKHTQCNSKQSICPHFMANHLWFVKSHGSSGSNEFMFMGQETVEDLM